MLAWLAQTSLQKGALEEPRRGELAAHLAGCESCRRYAALAESTAAAMRQPREAFPKRLAWTLMESPSVVVFALVFLAGSRAQETMPRIFAALWLALAKTRGRPPCTLRPNELRPARDRRLAAKPASRTPRRSGR